MRRETYRLRSFFADYLKFHFSFCAVYRWFACCEVCCVISGCWSVLIEWYLWQVLVHETRTCHSFFHKGVRLTIISSLAHTPFVVSAMALLSEF